MAAGRAGSNVFGNLNPIRDIRGEFLIVQRNTLMRFQCTDVTHSHNKFARNIRWAGGAEEVCGSQIACGPRRSIRRGRSAGLHPRWFNSCFVVYNTVSGRFSGWPCRGWRVFLGFSVSYQESVGRRPGSCLATSAISVRRRAMGHCAAYVTAAAWPIDLPERRGFRYPAIR
jgi:hypothetical protein